MLDIYKLAGDTNYSSPVFHIIKKVGLHVYKLIYISNGHVKTTTEATDLLLRTVLQTSLDLE